MLAVQAGPFSTSLRVDGFDGNDRTADHRPGLTATAPTSRKHRTVVERTTRSPTAGPTPLRPRLTETRFQQPGDDVGRLAIARFEEVAYTFKVVAALAWPRRPLTVRTGTPAASS